MDIAKDWNVCVDTDRKKLIAKEVTFSGPIVEVASFLKQRISMVLQIGNAACVLRTVSDRDALE